MDDSRQTENNIVLSPSPIPSFTPLPSPEAVKVDESDGVEERIVYDGDISDSILAKLSAYYNENADGETYVILRPDQYNYYLVYGDYANGNFTNATIVHYHSQSGYNTVDCTVTVSQGSYRPDLTGDTGYIYSSIPEYLPSRYIDSRGRYANKSLVMSSVVLVLALCICIIGIWVSGIRKKWIR